MIQIEKQGLLERVNKALADIRPHLEADGGDVEVVDITDDKIVRIKWLGACEGCNMSFMTLRAGLEETIRNRVPEIMGLEAVNGMHS